MNEEKTACQVNALEFDWQVREALILPLIQQHLLHSLPRGQTR